jgi:adenylate kinase family enzyme
LTKVAVIGNAGGGKSTLCRRLSAARQLPLYVVDDLQWRPGWVQTPAEEFRRLHDAILEQERWIIDGWGARACIEQRFEAADTLILVDFPLYVHYWWALKRQFKSLLRPAAYGPAGCPMWPVTWRLLKLMWTLHRTARPELIALINRYAGRKAVFHLRSPRELRRFMQANA